MKFRNLLVYFPFFLHAWGQTISVRVVGVTHTQAILSYVAPDANPCSIEVSESPSYAPLVHDVNPSLFAGANSDAGRSLTTGQQRIVVIGKRTSDTGADGKLYSRALATDTVHYVRVTCGAAQGTTHFKTRPLAWHNTSTEPPPFNPNGFGNYAWPSIDWTPAGRSKEYVDPMTGVKLKFAGWPGSHKGGEDTATPSADAWWDWNGAWTNPGNIRSGGTAALASTTTANAPIFVAIEPGTNILGSSGGAGGYGIRFTIDDVGLRIYGSGTDSDPANRTIQVCLSMDSGQSCYSPAISVTLPQGSPVDNGTFPSTYPTPMYGSWGIPPIRQTTDWPRGEGTVDVAGNTVTLTNLSSRTRFLAWPPGTKIWISGSSPTCPHNVCTISSVQNASQLTLQESLSLTGATYRAFNFGYRIWKTTGTGTVSVSMRKALAYSSVPKQEAGGSHQKCSLVPITISVDRTGNPAPPQKGYLCKFPLIGADESNAAIFWISEDTGESRVVAIPYWDRAVYVNTPLSGDRVPAGAIGFTGKETRWDLTDGRVFYEVAGTNSGKTSIFKVRYTGDGREYNNGYGIRPTPPLEFENITKPSENRDIQSQEDAYGHPDWDPSVFGYVTGAFSANSGHIILVNFFAGQDGPAWFAMFDFNGNLVRLFNTWSDPPWDGVSDSELPFRWMGAHSIGADHPPVNGTGWYKIAGTNCRTTCLGPGGANQHLRGPFRSPVIAVKRSTGWDTTNTSVSSTIGDPSYDSACPPDIPPVWQNRGATGNNCLTIRIGGEPCSANPTATEKTRWPCPWDPNRSTFAGQTLQVGDTIRDARTDVAEPLLIVRKTVNAVNDIELVLVRRFDRFMPQGHAFASVCTDQTHNNGWQIITRETFACGGERYMFTDGRKVVDQWVFGHSDTGVGALPGTMKGVGSGGFRKSQAPSQSIGPYQNGHTPFASVNFDGVSSGVGGLQSYPTLRHNNATGSNSYWSADNHHIEILGGRSMSLVTGQTYTYQLGVIGSVDIKRKALIAWSSHYLLRDISGPGSLISDATPWTYCYAYRAGECRPGSTAGQFFISAPNITGTSTSCAGFDHFADVGAIPCAVSGGRGMSTFRQYLLDAGNGIARDLTMGFAGHNRQNQFMRGDVMPEGKWIFVPSVWIDGVRSEFLIAKTPSVEPLDNIRRDRFQDITVKVPPVPGATQAVIDFGYEEFGAKTDFYCTSRKESCVVPGLTPFSYASESISPQACTSGCTITIPGLPEKILYYRVRWLDASGAIIKSGNLEAVAIP